MLLLDWLSPSSEVMKLPAAALLPKAAPIIREFEGCIYY
jgi:hypothetical protein